MLEMSCEKTRFGWKLAAVVALSATCGVASALTVQPAPVEPGTDAEAWHASWIWGPPQPNGPKGCFRKCIEVGPGLAQAWAQLSGDDGYTFYVNGTEARKGGFWWHTTDRVNVTALLHAGTNVLAAELGNAADPGGWLMELTLAYDDGRAEIVPTDATWRFAAAPQDGWLTVGFDDAAWAACVALGKPPECGPWGDLPYEYLGPRAQLDVVATSLPDAVEAGATLTGFLDVRLAKPLAGDPAFTVRLLGPNGEVMRQAWALRPAPDTWPVGEVVRIELPQASVSRFLAQGAYTVEYALSRACAAGVEGNVLASGPLAVSNSRQGMPPDAAVKPCQGSPALYLDGAPAFPMWFWQNEISRQDAQAFHAVGVDTFTFSSPAYYLHPGWVDEGKYDYTEFDAIMLRLLDANPNARCVPRIFVAAPKWWLDKYPEECCTYATGVGWQDNGWGGTRHESFASTRWREDSGEAFRRFVAHIMQAPYSDRVIGIHVINGIYGEWHAWSATDVPDTSEPMRRALVRYVKERYRGDVDALRRAWGEPTLEFDTVAISTLEERRTGDLGMFRDPARSRKVVDYYECFHGETATAIDHFCSVVKEASGGRLLTCVFYSYAPDLDWPQEGDHRAAARVHRFDSVDLMASPHSYCRRQLGDDGLFRNFPASVALHGKLFLDEADDRTYLARDPSFTHVKTAAESLEVIRREFANAVTHGTGLWYMDQQGDWFHDESLMADIGRLKRWGDVSMTLPRESVGEVAVISALESEFYLCGRDSGKNHVTGPLYITQIGELCRSGAPFDWYLIEDLAEGLIPPHKVYVFLDCFYLDPAQRAAIEALKSSGNALVWFYAPGYVSHDALSLAAMEQLTGLAFEQHDTGVLQAKSTGLYAGASLTFGVGNEQSPVFVPRDPAAAVAATWADGADPAVVSKDCGTWTSVYCGVPQLPAPMLHEVFRRAGVHLYCDSGDNLSANASWVALHTASAGLKTVRLPRPANVYDVLNSRGLGDDLQEFQVDLPSGATALFALDLPETAKRP